MSFRNSGSTSNISRPSTGRNKVIVAIDFGTTNSAVAWVYARPRQNQNVINIVQDWPDKSNTQDKVPTLLRRTPDGKSGWQWGFSVPDSEPRYEWFKLEQDPKYSKDGLLQSYPETTIVPDGEAEVEDLITTYLRHIREHSEKQIRESFSLSDTRSLLNVPWEYILTVPAMWPEPAQNITLRCAQNAGMVTRQNKAPRIIAEPEAAGVYALSNMLQELDLKVGDTFMICDAGGGTVDLISYTITKTPPGPLISEASLGTGGLCGSSFLDRGFSNWIRRMMSRSPSWRNSYYTEAMKRWEAETKRNFDGDPKHTYLFSVPGMPDDSSFNVRGEKFHVSGSVVKGIFEPVVEDILRLVNNQIRMVQQNKRSVKAILMAGGFGNNTYLRNVIGKKVGSEIKVVKVRDCDTAIVRGAILQGLADNARAANSTKNLLTVESRLARKHYGTEALAQYNPQVHDSRMEREPGGLGGGERVKIIHWFIKKGDTFRNNEPKEFDFYYDESVASFDLKGNQFDKIDIPIYVCEEAKAPVHPENGSQDKSKVIVKLSADLNKIPKDALMRELGPDHQEYYKIPFKIQMLREFESLKFDLVHERKREDGTIQRVSYGGAVVADWTSN